MKQVREIKSCYIGPEISPEQFVPEHFFVFLAKGKIHGYDGEIYTELNENEAAFVRKNRLARYNKELVNGEFEKIVIVFDELFLRRYQSEKSTEIAKSTDLPVFTELGSNPKIIDFMHSLGEYQLEDGKIFPTVADHLRIELLDMLLALKPHLSGVLFDFGRPHKINLEEFMCRNYRFNVSIQRFAFLTGRSVSGFKREFREIFDLSPAKWLVQRRLREAYFLIYKKQRKPVEIYLELGFEDLSHFSYAFKKLFGKNPSALTVNPSRS